MNSNLSPFRMILSNCLFFGLLNTFDASLYEKIEMGSDSILLALDDEGICWSGLFS